MAILINGMEIPAKGCRLIIINADGTVLTTDGETTAVPVPPHGRLGDLDALFKQVTMDEHFSVLEAMYVQSLISNAPTIISADPEEEEMK